MENNEEQLSLETLLFNKAKLEKEILNAKDNLSFIQKQLDKAFLSEELPKWLNSEIRCAS